MSGTADASTGSKHGKSRFSRAIQNLIRKKEAKKVEDEVIKVHVESKIVVDEPSLVTKQEEPKTDDAAVEVKVESARVSSNREIGDEVKTVVGDKVDEAKAVEPKEEVKEEDKSKAVEEVKAAVEPVPSETKNEGKSNSSETDAIKEEAKPGRSVVADAIKGFEAGKPKAKPKVAFVEEVEYEEYEEEVDDEYDEESSVPSSTPLSSGLLLVAESPSPPVAPIAVVSEEESKDPFSNKMALPPPDKTGSKITRTVSYLVRESSTASVAKLPVVKPEAEEVKPSVAKPSVDQVVSAKTATEEDKRALVDGLVRSSGPIKRIIIEY